MHKTLNSTLDICIICHDFNKCILILTDSKSFKKKGEFVVCTLPFVFPWVHLFGRSTNNLQQEKEDLDDVDVNGECGEHILLWADGVLPVAYQQLGVVS